MTVRYVSVKGFTGYCVGSDGSIWSSKRGYWKQLKPFPVNKYGHLAVDLHTGNGRKGKRYVTLVHRLVLLNLKGPCPPNKKCVLHSPNDDPTDNRLCNLKWGSPQDNTDDMIRKGRQSTYKNAARGVNHGSAKLTEIDVLQIRDMRSKHAWTFTRIAAHFKISVGTAKSVVYRKTWSHLN